VKGLVHDLFNEWLKPRRAFRLVNAGEMGTIHRHRDQELLEELAKSSTARQ
jgi:hypothetical protein